MDCTGTHSARSAGRRVRATAVHVLCFVALGVSLYYLTWRALYTFNPHALWLSLLLYAAECYGVVVFIFHLVSTWDTRRLERSFGLRPSETMADAIMPPPPPSSVDVFVTTYDESVALLRKTVIAAREIRLEHETWVLDDGRRDEVRELCEELGVRYLSRGSNAHAKAGNINAAMSRTRGEFIVVLDADFIALPSLLERTLGYFTDQNLAFVQLPQAFYNIDSVQHVEHDLSAGWHEQSLFYDVIQPGKNRWNAAFWCGTPTVLRRSALETVGGVAISAVTEDVLTSLRLHAAGWRSAYHNETLAVGIAPGDLEAFCIQRLRWAQGSMQILRSRENPLIKPGLSLFQRASYLASMTAYFQALQLLVFALMPFLIVASGQTPLTDFARPFLERFVPYVVLVIVAIKATAGSRQRLVWDQYFSFLRMFTFLQALPTLLTGGRRLGFRVTPKGPAGSPSRRALYPHIAVAGINLLAIAGLALLPHRAGLGLLASVIVGCSAAAVACICLCAIVRLWRRAYRRRDYRVPALLPTFLNVAHAGAIAALSEEISFGGLSLAHARPVGAGTPVELRILLGFDEISVAGRVATSTRLGDERFRIGIEFAPLPLDHEARLLNAVLELAGAPTHHKRSVQGVVDRTRLDAQLALAGSADTS